MDNFRHVLIFHAHGAVATIDIASGEPVGLLQIREARLTSVDIDRDNRLIATGFGTDSPGIVILRHNDNGHLSSKVEISLEPTRNFVAKFDLPSAVRMLRFCRSGQMLAAALRSGEIHVFDTRDWSIIRVWKAHKNAIFSATVAGEEFISASKSGLVRRWHLESGELLTDWQADNRRVTRIVGTQDGRRFFTGSPDGEIRMWDSAGRLLKRMTGHYGSVTSLALLDGDSTLASGGFDSRIILWDVLSGEQQLELRGHAGPITELQFNEQTRHIISSSRDSSVRIWGFSELRN